MHSLAVHLTSDNFTVANQNEETTHTLSDNSSR